MYVTKALSVGTKISLSLLVLILSTPTAASEDVFCISQAVFHEAVGEPLRGQVAVAQVIMARVASRKHPNSPCKVVRYKRRGICHFSFLCVKRDLGIRQQDIPNKHLAESIAECVLEGACFVPSISGATVYYACGGKNKIPKPNWDWTKLTFKAKIGNHCFYEEVV